MPDDPVGNYTLPPSYHVTNGDVTDASQHNPPFEDIADAMTNRLHRDGRTSWTGNQNANGNKLTGLAEGTNPTDAVRVAQLSNMGIPVGTVIDYAGSTAPDGWIICDGRAVSRTDFAALFAVVGTTFGNGDGSTTFNVPDLRGRVVAGLDNMGGAAASRLGSSGLGTSATSVGASGGTQTHTLTTAQMPSHSHSASTSSSGAHTHTVSNVWITGSGDVILDVSDNFPVNRSGSRTTSSSGAHTHTVTVQNAGGGDPHPNVQPTMVMLKIIKAN